MSTEAGAEQLRELDLEADDASCIVRIGLDVGRAALRITAPAQFSWRLPPRRRRGRYEHDQRQMKRTSHGRCDRTETITDTAPAAENTGKNHSRTEGTRGATDGTTRRLAMRLRMMLGAR